MREVKKKGGGRGKSTYKKNEEGRGGASGDGAGKGKSGGGGKESQSGGKTITNCGRCKRDHLQGACPAKDIKCGKCGKIGHFADCCRSNFKSNNAVFKVNSVGGEEPLRELETVINGEVKMVTWLMDTGAQVSLLGPQHLERFGAVKPRPSRDRLATALNFTSKVVGLVDVTVKAGEKSHKSSMYVVNGLKRPILDFKSLVSLGLINEGWPNVCALSLEKARRQVVDVPRAEGDTKVREEFFSEFPEVFPDYKVVQPLAKMTGPEMKIELVEGAKPYKRFKANNIPLHWRDPVKKQLDTMVEKDIAEIDPVGENPEWVLGMVCVAKKGKINDPHITVDFKPVNRYVKRLGHRPRCQRRRSWTYRPG